MYACTIGTGTLRVGILYAANTTFVPQSYIYICPGSRFEGVREFLSELFGVPGLNLEKCRCSGSSAACQGAWQNAGFGALTFEISGLWSENLSLRSGVPAWAWAINEGSRPEILVFSSKIPGFSRGSWALALRSCALAGGSDSESLKVEQSGGL